MRSKIKTIRKPGYSYCYDMVSTITNYFVHSTEYGVRGRGSEYSVTNEQIITISSNQCLVRINYYMLR